MEERLTRLESLNIDRETIISIAFFAGKILFIFGLLFGFIAPMMVWVERRVCGLIQDRYGPNRVGPFGLLQTMADGIKLLLKEDLRPTEVHPGFFILAPILAVIPAAMGFAAIPFGPETTLGGILREPQRLQIANLNVGFLYVLAIGSLGVYSVALAGWASNNKYTVLGALRASAQMISYELAAGLSIVTVVILSGSVDLVKIVESQKSVWNIFPGFLAFLVFLPAIFAETNRTPFDLAESEAELVAGFHTEYSGMKFGLFFLAEYVNMATVSAMAVLLFFGGWELLPWLPWAKTGLNMDTLWFLPTIWFFVKLAFFLFFFVWIRWTVPRFRYDQLMALGWKTLIPISLFNMAATTTILVFQKMP
ncbi:MAG: NADH-quinone oxidoreductase subunit [Bacteriovoracaceae bacterium]|nr:NADH-quinone oxidoreductase subunit [Bacteriovoracaceae bacterium]